MKQEQKAYISGLIENMEKEINEIEEKHGFTRMEINPFKNVNNVINELKHEVKKND